MISLVTFSEPFEKIYYARARVCVCLCVCVCVCIVCAYASPLLKISSAWNNVRDIH